MTLTFGGELHSYAIGENTGKCTMSDGARPLAQSGSAVGRGAIRLARTG